MNKLHVKNFNSFFSQVQNDLHNSFPPRSLLLDTSSLMAASSTKKKEKHNPETQEGWQKHPSLSLYTPSECVINAHTSTSAHKQRISYKKLLVALGMVRKCAKNLKCLWRGTKMSDTHLLRGKDTGQECSH